MNKHLKRLIIVLSSISAFILTINIIPPKKVIKENPFVKGENDKVMIAAHRGGGVSNPENTLKAYKAAVNEFKVDIIETDLWMTKDNHLVYMHDSTLNRTSDIEVLKNSTDKFYINDFTLDELKLLNMGYNFTDEEGNQPYRNLCDGLNDEDRKKALKENDLQIVEIDELFEEFYTTNPDLLFIVEIKNGDEAGYKAANIIDDVLTNYYPNYKNRLVIGTFHPEIEKDLKKNHPTLLRGASTSGAAKFIFTQMFRVNIFENQDNACLQLPTSLYGIDLTWKTYIKRAHKKNIAVQYWTINDEETMRYLIDRNVDAIMTDNPKLLSKVINEN